MICRESLPMRTFLIILVVLLGCGVGYVYAYHPSNCAKLAIDVDKDLANAWKGLGDGWDGLGKPLTALVCDTAYDLDHIVSAPCSVPVPAPVPEPATAPVEPLRPAWTAPATFPAKPNWTWTTLRGDVFQEVKVVGMEEHSVTIIFNGGGRHVAVADLGVGLQKELGYDPAIFATEAARRQEADNAARAADASRIPDMATGWETDNYDQAVSQARAQHKKLLLHFTGSDYCPSCQQFDREIAPTAEFRNYVSTNFVLVTLDLPRQKPQSEALKQQNASLAGKYHLEGVPTLIATESDGTEISRLVGCPPSAKDFVDYFSRQIH